MLLLFFSHLTSSEWSKTIPRPFALRYDSYTQSVQVMDSKASISRLCDDVKYEMNILQDAVNKIQ